MLNGLTFSGGGSSKLVEVVRVGMKLNGSVTKELIVYAVPHICEPLSSQPVTLCVDKYEHLANLDLADPADENDQMAIDMLIGSDYYWELTTGKIIRGESGPVAIHTRLGWVLSGPVDSQHTTESVSLIATTTHSLRVDCLPEVEKLDKQLRSFWEVESLGIQTSNTSVYEEFSSTIQFKNGRYEVSLPWKGSQMHLADNYQLCLKRLQGLMRRLRQDESLLKEYNSIIECQLQQGIVEVAETLREGEKVHYLPHHPVIRQDKDTTKVRVVYDASAKSDGGQSLNSCLYTGPKFDQKILDILLRFRCYKVALTADIEKAFLMVSVAENDRDVLRFLWYDDVFKDDPRITVMRFARVVFGVSASPSF